jgi:formylglycine-generating enzyme required for sulfatase activity
VSAIFISYTGRDPEGDAWADRLTEWFKEWKYGFFRDKDHSHGVKAGDDWRQTLFGELADARAMVSLCSEQYDSSPWCVGEVAIAVEKGKTVIPIQLGKTAEALKREPLPLLLQTRQAIKVADAANPRPEQLTEVKQRLQAALQGKLNWRDLQHWDRKLAPYPGLPAFEANQAPVFFGRDKAIVAVVERLARLALRPPAFLLLLGASGYGKSSLLRAGVVPRLKGENNESWVVLPPFTPGDEPFKELEDAVVEAGGVFNTSDPLGSLQELQRKSKASVVLVIDQFEELLTAGPRVDGKADQGEAFQLFLLQLLRVRKAGLLVLATMRTDFLTPLQTRWRALTGMASTYILEPIEPEHFGALITGPADRSGLTLEPGLEARLVKESGGRDALPLLAFTLEQLWKARKEQVLTLKDYEDLGGVEGAVSTRAKECWDPQTSSVEVRQAMREAFLDHLVSVSSEGRMAKRPAPLADLPIASREIVQRMVNDRLLVLKESTVEIAHEALLRTWEPLVGWIEEGRKQLEQRRRVARFSGDLALTQPLAARLAALQGLLVLSEADPGEVVPPADALGVVLTHPEGDPQEWLLAIQLLGLVGGDAAVAALSTFLEQRQIPELLETALAVRRLEALCKAAAALQRIHCRTPPVEKDEARWLLLLSATVRDDGGAVRSELMRLRLWATPRLEAPGAWVEPLGEGVALTMVAIPAGRFVMGSPPEEEHRSDNEGPQPLVELEGFWMGQTPITQAQWRQVMGELPAPWRWPQTPESNPSDFSDKSDSDQHPVERVSYHDATEFCKLLSQQTGRCYTLPSEAQWEYACRGGTVTPFNFGNTITLALANYRGNSTNANGLKGEYRRQTTPVGLFPANAWGLHDLHGNVWEWCAGRPWLDGNKKKRRRVLRGGSWFNCAEDCRSARRYLVHPGFRHEYIGFRVCCLPQG